jgi:hypothetical protein
MMVVLGGMVTLSRPNRNLFMWIITTAGASEAARSRPSEASRNQRYWQCIDPRQGILPAICRLPPIQLPAEPPSSRGGIHRQAKLLALVAGGIGDHRARRWRCGMSRWRPATRAEPDARRKKRGQ